MWLAYTWRDYEVLDCGDGEKLERWGETILLRPDPQAIWPAGSRLEATTGLNAHYHRSASGGGEWEVLTRLQDPWQISYRKLTFEVGLMGFKHTGLFPEQAVNWDWMGNQLQGKENAEVLNLFGYTGAATVACAAASALSEEDIGQRALYLQNVYNWWQTFPVRKCFFIFYFKRVFR